MTRSSTYRGAGWREDLADICEVAPDVPTRTRPPWHMRLWLTDPVNCPPHAAASIGREGLREPMSTRVVFIDNVCDPLRPGQSGHSSMIWEMAAALIAIGHEVEVVAPVSCRDCPVAGDHRTSVQMAALGCSKSVPALVDRVGCRMDCEEDRRRRHRSCDRRVFRCGRRTSCEAAGRLHSVGQHLSA